MEAKELMIGDWVRFKKADGTIKDIKVSVVSFNLDNLRYSQPIPLTREICEANGIRTDGNYNEPLKGDTQYALELTWYDGDLCWTDNGCEYLIMSFKYVHELQHAMRLVGATELADNFKLE